MPPKDQWRTRLTPTPDRGPATQLNDELRAQGVFAAAAVTATWQCRADVPLASGERFYLRMLYDQTMVDKYGVSNPMKNADVRKKYG